MIVGCMMQQNTGEPLCTVEHVSYFVRVIWWTTHAPLHIMIHGSTGVSVSSLPQLIFNVASRAQSIYLLSTKPLTSSLFKI